MTGLGALYRRWLLEMWHADEDDLEAIAADLASAQLVVHNGRDREPPTPVGPAGLVDIVRQARGLFRDSEVTLDVGPLVDGEFVAARWTFSGTYTGGIPGTDEAKGTTAELVGMDLMRIREGRIVEYWALSDGADLMAQLGG